jgi:hypothetical protein
MLIQTSSAPHLCHDPALVQHQYLGEAFDRGVAQYVVPRLFPVRRRQNFHDQYAVTGAGNRIDRATGHGEVGNADVVVVGAGAGLETTRQSGRWSARWLAIRRDASARIEPWRSEAGAMAAVISLAHYVNNLTVKGVPDGCTPSPLRGGVTGIRATSDPISLQDIKLAMRCSRNCAVPWLHRKGQIEDDPMPKRQLRMTRTPAPVARSAGVVARPAGGGSHPFRRSAPTRRGPSRDRAVAALECVTAANLARCQRSSQSLPRGPREGKCARLASIAKWL